MAQAGDVVAQTVVLAVSIDWRFIIRNIGIAVITVHAPD